MSSIDSLSSAMYVAPPSTLQATQSTQVSSSSDPDGDGDGGQKVKKHGGHGHGQMQNVLAQALQSLGLGGTISAPSSTVSTSAGSTQNSSGTDSDGDSDGSTSATSSVKSDMRQFMHALFQAVKGEGAASGSSGTAASGNGDPKANFAAGLSALISQVSNGQAPADLQSAFAKVVNDLQGVSAAGSTSTSSTSTGTAGPQVSLQALLSQMQQNLGYGAASSTSALGNIFSGKA